jgi:hypothetical protein
MNKSFVMRANFRLAADSVLRTLGLESVTTPRMANNGTMKYYDPGSDCFYSISEGGYVRRYIKRGYKCGGRTNQYQLNRRIQTGHRKTTVLHNPLEQLGILVSVIDKYRVEVMVRETRRAAFPYTVKNC